MRLAELTSMRHRAYAGTTCSAKGNRASITSELDAPGKVVVASEDGANAAIEASPARRLFACAENMASMTLCADSYVSRCDASLRCLNVTNISGRRWEERLRAKHVRFTHRPDIFPDNPVVQYGYELLDAGQCIRFFRFDKMTWQSYMEHKVEMQ